MEGRSATKILTWNHSCVEIAPDLLLQLVVHTVLCEACSEVATDAFRYTDICREGKGSRSNHMYTRAHTHNTHTDTHTHSTHTQTHTHTHTHTVWRHKADCMLLLLVVLLANYIHMYYIVFKFVQ